MPDNRSLAHEDFLKTLRTIETEGKTSDERELARVARELYERTYWHQPVVEFVNAEALRVLEGS